ncbi:MAG TPA: RidA family protein [Hyphomicrobiaceae bacterium]|nr:RidA family protein [Hyphomicrobiaceae bacterium]
MASLKAYNSKRAPQPAAGYAQAVKLESAKELLFVSGQIPVAPDGAVPATFGAQARLAWANVIAQIEDAGMSLDDLAKVTIFLSDRAYAAENRAIRQDVLGQRSVALTVIITGIFDSAWLLEIEAIAAR